MIKFEKVDDLLAAAQQIEADAAERYMEYAEVAAKENSDVAALFSRLAEEERKHEDCVMRLAEEASVDLSKVAAPENDVSARNTEVRLQAHDSLYKIIAAAVGREDRAFEIYSQIAANSNDDDVRQYAEKLAKEELSHAALLRAMRRRVYNENKIQIKTKILPGPDKLDTLEEFLDNAYILEKSVSTYIDRINNSEVDMKPSKKHSEFIIDQLVYDISDRSSNAGDDINKLDDLSSKKNISEITNFTLDNLLNECESVYEYYDSFILNAVNEEIMQKALFLASQTLTQLVLLQEIKNTCR